MTTKAESAKPYTDEWKRRRLLEGQDFHPSKYRRRSDRTIQTSWLADAVKAGKKIDIENAIVAGPLALRNAIFSDEVIIRRAVFQDAVDLSYVTFKRPADFSRTTFQKGATFYSTSFKSDVFFNSTRFEEEAIFSAAKIGGTAEFNVANFKGETRFVTFAKKADFGSTKIDGQAQFKGAMFKGEANFNGANITGGAFFKTATFEGEADFGSTKIGSAAEFNGATFKDKAIFNQTSIEGAAFFKTAAFEGEARCVTFEKEANFVAAKIGSNAEFNGATFKGKAIFNGASIEGVAFFDPATFEGETRCVTFEKEANFDNAEVAGPAIFNRSQFSKQAPASFSGTMFRQGAFSQQATCKAPANFRTARFDVEANFDGMTFGGGVSFDHAQFAGDARFVETVFGGDAASFRETTFRSVFFSDGERAAQFATLSINLVGCTYEHIAILNRPSLLDRMLRLIIRRTQVPKNRSHHSYWQSILARQPPAARQPYTQLESTFRAAGRDVLADNVYFLRRWRETKKRRFIGDPLGLLLLLLVGYGVRRWFLFAWMAVVLSLGTPLFHEDGSVVPRDEEAVSSSVMASSCPPSEDCRLSVPGSIWFTLNSFLPIEIPAGSQWKPSTRPVEGLGFMTYESLSTILRIAGWIMIPIGVAAFTGILQRRTPSG